MTATTFQVICLAEPEPTLAGVRDTESAATELARTTHDTDQRTRVIVTDGTHIVADFKNGLNHVFTLPELGELAVA